MNNFCRCEGVNVTDAEWKMYNWTCGGSRFTPVTSYFIRDTDCLVGSHPKQKVSINRTHSFILGSLIYSSFIVQKMCVPYIRTKRKLDIYHFLPLCDTSETFIFIFPLSRCNESTMQWSHNTRETVIFPQLQLWQEEDHTCPQRAVKRHCGKYGMKKKIEATGWGNRPAANTKEIATLRHRFQNFWNALNAVNWRYETMGEVSLAPSGQTDDWIMYVSNSTGVPKEISAS